MAFVDLGHGDVHSAVSPSATEVTVLVATFIEAPETGALVIPAETPADCVIEARQPSLAALRRSLGSF
jgi:hypothetical protein